VTAQLSFAFIAGTVATANPCGFGLLPGYLARLLADDGSRSRPEAVARALAVGALTTIAFLVVFGTVGTMISLGGRVVISLMPWAGLAVGAALVVVGLAVLAGRHVGFRAPLQPRPSERSGYRGAFAFGLAYGVCSLACTLPIFLMVVGTSLSGPILASGLAFVAYAAGMGSILTALAVAAALARGGLTRSIRRLLPHVNRVSGALLVLVGIYVVYYWAFALADAKAGTTWSRPLDTVSAFSSSLQTWLAGGGGRSAAAWLLAAVVGAVAWVLWWRATARLVARRGPARQPPEGDAATSVHRVR
jgi:cytochrome c biogenesis protein CcdA